MSQIHPISPEKTKSVPPLQHSKMSSKSNKFSLRQFLPERILTSSKAAHLTSTFSVVISRRSQDWMRTDRWAVEAQTGITYIAVALFVTFHKLLFQPQAFSLNLYEKFCLHSLTKLPCEQSLLRSSWISREEEGTSATSSTIHIEHAPNSNFSATSIKPLP